MFVVNYVLTPLLFNFCTKGCVEDTVNHYVGCQIGLLKWNVLAYADDIALITPSLKDLQKLIDISGDSIRNISLKIDVKKSIYIVF